MINKKEAKNKKLNIIDRDEQPQNENKEIIEKIKTIIPNIVNSDNVLNIEAISDLIDISNTTANNKGYELTFGGKGIAKFKYQMPTELCLKVEKEQSKNFETTKNMIIRGDNIDALKILKQNYSGKIKMIYIDPPYNTKSDNFLYSDDFRVSEKELIEEFGMEENTINYLENVYGNRSHSGWLSFMYPRLKLARDLLTDDGVIFISIDDNEQANLKIICDEIFGEESVDVMVWRKSGDGRDGKMKNTTTFRKDHEYIIVCFKSILDLNKSFETPDWKNIYPNLDNDPRGGYKAGSISRKDEVANPEHKYYYTVISPSGKKITRQFEIPKEEFDELNKDSRIYWGKNNDSIPCIKIFQNEKRNITTSSAIIEKEENLDVSFINDSNATTTNGTKELNSLIEMEGIGEGIRPKPSYLIKKMIQIGSNTNDIILDFFAGSGTTAHAVMQLNAEDNGNRRFILVQWDEKIDENESESKAAYDFCVQNNLETVISSIAIERVKRAGEKIKNDNPLISADLDLGYKVFTLTEKARIIDDGENMSVSLNNLNTLDKLYNMIAKSSKDITLSIEEIEKDSLYKIDNCYYILDNFKTDIKKLKGHQIFIDAYSNISLEKTLNLNIIDNENVSIIY